MNAYPELALYLREHVEQYVKLNHDVLHDGPQFCAVIYSVNEGGFFGQGYGPTPEAAMAELEADMVKVREENAE
jgi:hypothetical protein